MSDTSMVNIDESLWIKIIQDKTIINEKVLDILLYILKQPNKEASGQAVATALHTHHAVLNRIIANFSNRILKTYSSVKKPDEEDGTKGYWHIPFLGRKERNRFLWILRPELTNALVKLFDYEDRYYPPEEIRENEHDELLEIIEKENDELLSEGNVIQITINAHERNKQARILCLNKHGYKCSVCGFDFEEKYGPRGKGKIHVHHIIPISNYTKEYTLDPIKDLRPVCPNCHLMIHSKKEPLTIKELQDIINNAKNNT